MNNWNVMLFHIRGDTVDWENKHIDLAIIDLVLMGVINNHHDEIVPWRFHRRYSPGVHHFEFSFYSTKICAEMIKKQIENAKFYNELEASPYLLNYSWEEENKNDDELFKNIGDRSDEAPSEIKNIWPYYAQGLSESLMRLIGEFRSHKPDVIENMDLGTKLEIYRAIERQIGDLWFKYGVHSFFHHSHLIFGAYPAHCAIHFKPEKGVEAKEDCILFDIRGFKFE